MSVLDLRTDEIIAASPRVTAPPPAPSKFSAWRYVTAPVRGVAEAGAQGIAQFAHRLGWSVWSMMSPRLTHVGVLHSHTSASLSSKCRVRT